MVQTQITLSMPIYKEQPFLIDLHKTHKHATLLCVWISCTKFQPNQTANMESTRRHSLMPLSQVWFYTATIFMKLQSFDSITRR